MIRSMSAVRARVAELEALIDKREVWDNRRLGGESHGRPVVVARRAEVVSLDAPAGIGAKPVYRRASRRLDGRDPDPSARQWLWEGDLQRSRLEPLDEHADKPDGFPDLLGSDRHAGHHVTLRDGHDAQV